MGRSEGGAIENLILGVVVIPKEAVTVPATVPGAVHPHAAVATAADEGAAVLGSFVIDDDLGNQRLFLVFFMFPFANRIQYYIYYPLLGGCFDVFGVLEKLCFDPFAHDSTVSSHSLPRPFIMAGAEVPAVAAEGG